jgi:hypothetical protein
VLCCRAILSSVILRRWLPVLLGCRGNSTPITPLLGFIKVKLFAESAVEHSGRNETTQSAHLHAFAHGITQAWRCSGHGAITTSATRRLVAMRDAPLNDFGYSPF